MAPAAAYFRTPLVTVVGPLYVSVAPLSVRVLAVVVSPPVPPPMLPEIVVLPVPATVNSPAPSVTVPEIVRVPDELFAQVSGLVGSRMTFALIELLPLLATIPLAPIVNPPPKPGEIVTPPVL